MSDKIGQCQWPAGEAHCIDELTYLRAEVERLKVADKYAHKTVERLDAEIERLRKQQSGIMDGWDDWDRQVRESKDEVERLRAAIDEVLASLDEYETHHRHAYTMKCIRRVIARLAIPTY